jgi:hypothetical protein
MAPTISGAGVGPSSSCSVAAVPVVCAPAGNAGQANAPLSASAAIRRTEAAMRILPLVREAIAQPGPATRRAGIPVARTCGIFRARVDRPRRIW